MLNDENACIRYLMKEMDPSEEVLMERAMMEDDDLLIEVESLRQTLKRLDALPEKEPPAHVQESILNYASKKAENRKTSNFLFIQPIRFAAAAVLVLGVSIGTLWIYQGPSSTDPAPAKANSQASEKVTTPLNLLPVTTNRTDPWIDREQIIYFHDQFNAGSAEFDSILKNSMHKLTPLSNPFYYNTGSRTLQMTGAKGQR